MFNTHNLFTHKDFATARIEVDPVIARLDCADLANAKIKSMTFVPNEMWHDALNVFTQIAKHHGFDRETSGEVVALTSYLMVQNWLLKWGKK